MTENILQLLSILDSVLGQHRAGTNHEFVWFCPFCGHRKPKLAINIASGKWHCWVCNSNGRKIINLFRKLNVSKDQIKELAALMKEDLRLNDVEQTHTVLTIPAEYKPLWIASTDFEYGHAVRFIKGRGLTASDILRYQIGYCTDGLYSGRIIIPSYDNLGKLNYFVARAYHDANTFSYKNPPVSKDVIGFDFHINWKYPITICEGVFDAMAIKRNAIPVFGKTIQEKLKEKIIREDIQDIYLALDKDAMKQTLRIAEQMMKENRNVYLVPLDDKDPSKIGFEAMTKKYMKSAKKLTFSELIKLKVELA